MIDQRQDIINVAGMIVGVGLIGILAFVTWALIFREMPPANENALTLLIGILSANVVTVIGFFFGSSSTTKKQAETIDKMASTAQTAGGKLGGDPGAIVLEPGERATATATDDGTVISQEAP